MLFFLIVMCVGLVGLSAMAIPGLFHHGHLGDGSWHVTHTPPHGHPVPGSDSSHGFPPFLPAPRLLFSVLALYGTFGNVLALTHLPLWIVALLALLPALLVERFVLAPLWKLAFQFQGRPSSPLPALLMEDARAVTSFRNGKGLVRVIRDGRSVQLSARLVEGQSMLPVQVGDKLRIEETSGLPPL
ncbi:hypothetical protein F0U59_17695 [Archangium gephyra]|nr:hypothetical protein F0U59_17695 [Archangium gephyra]